MKFVKNSEPNHENHFFFYNSTTELQNHENLIISLQNNKNHEIIRIPHPELRKSLKINYSTITRKL